MNDVDASVKSAYVISSERHEKSAENFFRDVRVNGTNIDTFIDPGAGVCTMRVSVALRAGLRVEEESAVLEGFGNGEAEFLGDVFAEVEFDALKPKLVKFLVVSDEAQFWSVLLRRPFTKAEDVTYLRLGGDLIFANVDPTIFENDNESRMKLLSSEKTIIEAGEVNFIKVKVRGEEISVPVTCQGSSNKSVEVDQEFCKNVLMIEEPKIVKPCLNPITLNEIITDENVAAKEEQSVESSVNENVQSAAVQDGYVGDTRDQGEEELCEKRVSSRNRRAPKKLDDYVRD
ncbi:hypothetical protein QAD02_021738 [Eretmocerus hayati]|uniref:Uncharacterized protein n=1 Tax=Eretmocerus hayati TaxID=131215 RepID=A0ACC2PQR6_9HYME|nr:hypothetical protein QAD02_021738 [Eretmocerus hayati]